MLKKYLTERDIEISSLKDIVVKKYSLISEVRADKDQVKTQFSKAKAKLVGRAPLSVAKHILQDQLFGEIIKTREYLNLVDDEHTLALKYIQTCRTINKDLVHKLIDVAQVVISFMNVASKEDVKVLGVSVRSTMIISSNKFLSKNNHVKNVQNKAEALLKKVTSFKSNFLTCLRKVFLLSGTIMII